MLFRNKQNGGYLDAGPKHIRPAQHGTGNRGWIEWERVNLPDFTVFLRNSQTGGYLDGGPAHIRPAQHGTGNPAWISWKSISNGDGYYKLQCLANGAYLSGGSSHVTNNPNGDDVLWQVVESNAGGYSSPPQNVVYHSQPQTYTYSTTSSYCPPRGG